MIDYGAGAYGRTAYGQWTARTDGAAAIIAAATTASNGGATFGGGGTITALSTTSNVSADRIKEGASVISSESDYGSPYGLGAYGAGDFSAVAVNWERIRLVGGTVSASVTPTVAAKIIYQSDGTVTATTTISADSEVIVTGDGTAVASATNTITYLRIRSADGSTAMVSASTASGRHKWQDITSSTGGAWDGEVDADVTWTKLTTPSKTWTESDSPYR
jgi:hypothetical protein